MDIYRELEARFPNVHVDARFSVHPWIIAAEALVHHYCTTSIEALAAGTPRFALRPMKDELSEKEVPFGCSVECVSVEELLHRISECLALGKEHCQGRPLTWDYSWYVSNIGDHLAAEAIVRRISSICTNSRLGNVHSGELKALAAGIAYTTKKILRNTIRKGGFQHYLNHKFPHLARDELQGMLDAFGSANLECREFAGDFINIRRLPHEH